MVSDQSQLVAERAKRIYEDRLRGELEVQCRGKFVSIEPISGEYFVADSYGAVVTLARRAYPDRLAYVLRVGHDAALHLGGVSR